MRGGEEVEIRPATSADLAAFYGSPPKETVRAVAIFYRGELAAIGGVTVEPHGAPAVAFSDIREGVTAPKATVWRCAKEVMRFIEKSTKRPVLAGPSANFPNAGRVLERLGFVYVGEGENGEVYQWIPE